MLYTILKKCTLAGRYLEPGYEIDTDVMPVYTIESMENLVAEGKAETVKKPAKTTKSEPKAEIPE